MKVDERKSPLPEPLSSGSTSPRILRPFKPRSSSINSQTSNNSHNRSLSIASMESPRNSIVSIDEFRLPTRNNSTTSLSELNIKPKDKDRLINTRLKNNINTTVLFSDEDSETERPARRRSKSNSFLKKDFKIKFSEQLKKSNLSPITLPSLEFKVQNLSPESTTSPNQSIPSPQATFSPTNFETPSPLSLNLGDLPKKVIEQNRENFKRKSTKGGYSLKKNLLFSKEVRMELTGEDFKLKFVKEPKTSSSSDNGDSGDNGGDKTIKTDTSEKEEKKDTDNEKEEKKGPILSTLQQQNLINQMNRKWSKTKFVDFEKPKLKRRYSSSDDDF